MNNYSRRQFLKDSTLIAISVSPVVGSILLNGCEKKFKDGDFKSIKAFRLTIPETLFNAEFYFINCAQDGNKIHAEYKQEECYMVVRLPQQHIAEENFTDVPNRKAASAISGYSYLTFRIVFKIDNKGKSADKGKIELAEDQLLDWNNQIKKNFEFRLVVKKGHAHSLFEKYPNPIFRRDTTTYKKDTLIFENKVGSDNNYPLNYRKQDLLETFDSSLFPKVDGQPITAIEAPWRLILSPMLSDEKKYIFSWEFSKKPIISDNVTYAELWMATLIIKDNPSYKAEKEKIEEDKKSSRDSAKVEDLEKKIKAIELMIIGSPDLVEVKDTIEVRGSDSLFHKPISDTSAFKEIVDTTTVDMFGENVLPKREDRADLVTLYIRYKLLARTDKISFTPFGISIYIDFKNNDTANNGISLIGWKHLISLGRDEEVEVLHLIIDKLFGHKMIHIISTKRTTKNGKSFLRKIEYIMPLEIEKDYSTHEDYETDDSSANKSKVSKFNFPFKKAVFIDKEPKKIAGLTDPIYDNKTKVEFISPKPDEGKEYIYIPLEENGNPVKFEYLVTDWDDNSFKVSKSIEAISYDLLKGTYSASDKILGDNKMQIIDDFFNPPTNNLSVIDQLLEDNRTASTKLSILQDELSSNYNIEKVSETINEIKRLAALPPDPDKISQLTKKYRDNITDFKAQVDTIYSNKLNGIEIDPIIDSSYKVIKDKTEEAVTHFAAALFDSTIFKPTNIAITKIQEIKNSIDNFKVKIDTVFGSTQAGLQNKFLNIKSDLENNLNKYLWYDLFTIDNIIKDKDADLKGRLAILIKTATDLNDKISNIPGAINLYRNKVAYAVNDAETTVELGISQTEAIVSENISKLETEFIAFKGKLKTDKNKNNVIDFFNEFASIPQLDVAKVYVDKINKIVNDEIPLNIKYAEDYVKNQIDLTKMEVTNNASKVFANVFENSRELVRTEMRKLSKDLGGIVNPELPVELLTALKHPKAPQDVINILSGNLPDEIKKSIEDAKKYEKQLIFISEEAKNTYNDLKQFRFQPADFFKALEAKILGSIRLKDILGIDFSIPNVTYLEIEKKVAYNFITDKLVEKDLGLIKFIPNANKKNNEPTKLQVYADKSWDNAGDYSSFSRLNNFAISIKPLGGDLLKVLFNEIKISSSSQRPKDISVKIDDVKFDGVLNFLAVLAEKIKMPGTGMRIIPSFKGIEIGYSLPLPSISSPGFNFSNIKLDLALHIHFPNSQEVKPITISIGLNRPEDKFLLSVGIYGGRGHFVLEATPNKVVSIDTAFEFGGIFALDINIAKGQAFLMVGIRYQKDNLTGVVIITGYLTCGGSMTVYGFITIGVLFIMLLEYNISDNTIIGEAAVSYSIKIGFFKKSFTLHYTKVMKGTERTGERPQAQTLGFGGSSSNNNSEDGRDLRSFDKYYTEKEWEEYLSYFEI